MNSFYDLIQNIQQMFAQRNIPTGSNSPVNLHTQINAISNMNPQQATQYRQGVEQVVPHTNPQIVGNTPLGYFAEQTMNAVPQAVIGAASLPAARNPWEVFGDVGKIASGAMVGAGGLHAARQAIPNINPQWITNQRGAAGLPLNTRVDQMTSRPMGGPSMARSGFNKSQGILPQSDRIQTTGGYTIPAQSNNDALIYEGAMKSGNVGLMNKLMELHPQDARFSVHATFPNILKNINSSNPVAATGIGRSIHPADIAKLGKMLLPGTNNIPL